jgi:methyl-accepting chemotaxis protein
LDKKILIAGGVIKTMTTKISTGIAKGITTEEAVRKAVEDAKNKLGEERIDLSIVYSSTKYDYKTVVDIVRKLTNKAPLVGCSTAGEFTEEKVENGSVAVGLIHSDEMKFFTTLAVGVKEDERKVIKNAISKISSEVEGYPYKWGIVFVDGLAGKGEEIALSVANSLGLDVPLVGGAAGDDLKFEKTYVFCDDKVETNAASICAVFSKSPIFTAVNHGHVPLSEQLVVTKSKGSVLYEINNRPAWDVWKEKTKEDAKKVGINVDELSTPTQIGSFLIRYELGIPILNKFKVRVPLSKNEDGSLNFACTIPQGLKFHIMKSEKEKQIESAKQCAEIAKNKLGNLKVAGALIFDCVVRGIILGNNFCDAVEAIKKVLGDIPIIGWETYGEICYALDEFSGFHNTTTVIALIPEEDY